MALFESWFVQDLNKPVTAREIKGNVFSQDSMANLIGVEVIKNGLPATLSGDVSGNIIRADGGTLAVDGTLEDNKCSIVLPAEAYAVPGVITIVIKLTDGEVVTTLLAIAGYVYRTSTDDAVYPGEIIPSIKTLIEQLENTVNAAQVALDGIEDQKDTMIASIASVAGQGTDTTLTQSGVAADAKATGDECSALKSAFELHTGYSFNPNYIDPTNNIWKINANYKHFIIPVTSGQAISVTTDTANVVIAFLKTYNVSANASVDYSSATGYDGAIQITADNTTKNYTVPSDANFLYVLYKTTSVIRSPKKCTIDGADIITPMLKTIAEMKAKDDETADLSQKAADAIANTGFAYVDALCLHDGYFDASAETKVWIANSKYKHIIIPVKAGQVISVIANDNNATVLAFLKSYAFVEGENVDLSSVDETVYQITKSTSAMLEVPSDANYVFILYKTPTVIRTPVQCMIDGYDFMQNAQNNFLAMGEELDRYRVIDHCSQILFDGYIHGDDNEWKASTESTIYKHSIIPVRAGDTFEICATNGVYAFLKSYRFIVGQTPDYATGTTFEMVTYYKTQKGTVPADAKYMYLIRSVGTNDRTPFLLRINDHAVYSAYENDLIKSSGQKFRLMTYNVGCFNWGAGSTTNLTEEQAQQCVAVYRQFLCKYAPDIICLQEYKESLDANGDYDSNDLMFDPVYPVTVDSSSVTRGKRIKSKINKVYSRVYSYTDQTSGLSSDVLVSKYMILGRLLTVVSGHLPYQSTQEAMDARLEIIKVMAQEASGEDFAILAADFNTNGNGSTVSSLQEAQNVAAELKTLGWESCNGGYLPWEVTYQNASDYPDNIFYKNNGKLTFADFKVVTDDTGFIFNDHYLFSDHYPIYADFVMR